MKRKQVYDIKPNPVKVVFYSNGPTQPTGYAKVIREITTRLQKDSRFQVYIIDELYFGPPTQWNNIPVFGLEGVNPNERHKSVNGFINSCKRIEPHVAIFLEDSFTLHNLGFTNLVKAPYSRVFYIPLDGDWIPDIGIDACRTMDKLVAMSKFTQKALAKEGFKSDMIWHGVDLTQFKPASVDEKKALRARMGVGENDFVLFNYGRNTNIRKNNQGLLRIVADFIKDKPGSVKFLMHTLDPEHPGNNLFDYLKRNIATEFGEEVANRIYFTPFRQNNPAPDGAVADMIRASDLVITNSMGEGFGLIMAEAMACGVPVISNDYTTPYELLMDDSSGIGPRGWLIKPSAYHVSFMNTEHAVSDHKLFVDTLNDIYNGDRSVLRERGVNGRLFAEKYLNWDYLVEQWKTVILKQV